MKNVLDRCLLGLVICIGLGLLGGNTILVVAQYFCTDEVAIRVPCTSDTCLPACSTQYVSNQVGEGIWSYECKGESGAAVAFGYFGKEHIPGSKKLVLEDYLAPCTILIEAQDCKITSTTRNGVVYMWCEAQSDAILYEAPEYYDTDCAGFA